MKKLFTGLLLFLSILVLYNFIDSNSLENNEMSIRNVYLENKSNLDYYVNKYDIYNVENTILEINESCYNEIENTSDNDIYEIDYNVLVNKVNNYFDFAYVLYKNNLEYLTSSVTITVLSTENEVCLFSNNGYYTTLEDLESSISKCAYELVSDADACLGISYAMNIDGVASSTTGSSVTPAKSSVGSTLAQAAATAIKIYTEYTVINETISQVNMAIMKAQYQADRTLRKRIIDDILGEAENDYGWTDDKLNQALSEALNLVVAGVLTKVSIINKEKFTVYLGRYIKNSPLSYEQYACREENAVVFNMDTEKWKDLEGEYSNEGMWILNKFFLAYCIAKDCRFCLTIAPGEYCKNGIAQEIYNIKGEKVLTFYARELEYIYSRGYIWSEGSPAFITIDRLGGITYA